MKSFTLRLLLIVLLLKLLSIAMTRHAVADEITANKLRFTSGDIELAGTLVLPKHGSADYAMVFVHGSGPQQRNVSLATHFAKKGVAVLVYDKRGVGESGGDYEAQQSVSGPNLNLLAQDAAAAFAALKAAPQLAAAKLGLAGISQAGWIVPLAAKNSTNVDFLVLWSGPVCKVSEEDIYSKYTADQDQPSVASYKEALGARKTRYHWPAFLGRDTDSAEDLATLSMPGLWVFGAQDGSIPVDLSVQRLETLQAQNKPFDYRVYSALGHNNIAETSDDVVRWITALK